MGLGAIHSLLTLLAILNTECYHGILSGKASDGYISYCWKYVRMCFKTQNYLMERVSGDVCIQMNYVISYNSYFVYCCILRTGHA